MWVIHHFRVLPTDDRFLKLSDDVKMMLFYGWVELPNSDEIRAGYVERNRIEFTEQDALELLDYGYSPEQTARIRRELESVGNA